MHYLWNLFDRVHIGGSPTPVVAFSKSEVDHYLSHFHRYDYKVKTIQKRVQSSYDQSITEALFSVPSFLSSYDQVISMKDLPSGKGISENASQHSSMPLSIVDNFKDEAALSKEIMRILTEDVKIVIVARILEEECEEILVTRIEILFFIKDLLFDSFNKVFPRNMFPEKVLKTYRDTIASCMVKAGLKFEMHQ